MLKITKNQGSIQVTADKSGFYPFDGTITFPTNSLFTATSANTDMITFKSTSNGDVQFVGNYKDITISGRSYDTKQKFLTAFSNLANQGSVDAYTKAETDAKLDDKLTAQTNAKGSLFIRSSPNDFGNRSLALYDSIVKGSDDVAIQSAITPDEEGMYNLAILSSASADGIQNIAIGAFQRCKGINNIGIGVGAGDPSTADVVGRCNVCIGSSPQAHTTLGNGAVDMSIAIGYLAKASNDYCTVIGPSANSKSSHAVAVGDGAYVDHDCDSSVAVGNSARAYGKNSVAIGRTSYADNDKPLDICCGKKDNNEVLSVLQSDSNGKISLLKGDGTNERMVIQDEIEALKNAGGGGTVDAYTKAETDAKLDAKQDKLTAGSGITITKDETAGTSTIATAVSLTDNGNGAYQVGDSIKMGNGVAIGKNVSGSNYSVAVGNNAGTTKSFNTVIGQFAYSYGDNSVAVGHGAEVKEYSSRCVAIGYVAQASDDSSISIGTFAKATKDNPLVINAGYKTVDDKRQYLTVLQSDSTGKISVLLGDGTDTRMVISDEITALKAEITALKAEIAALKGGASTGA